MAGLTREDDPPATAGAPSCDIEARSILRRMFDAAIASAAPFRVLAAHLPERPVGRCVVVGAGKSAASMAAALEAAWADQPLTGLVVTRYGHAVPTSRIAVMEAAHPVPDENSVRAAERMLALVRGLGPDDLVLALISGGGSALLALPLPGLTLADKQAVNRTLLASGATIAEMNAVRRRLSAIKGGRLAAAAAPARVVTLAISDVPGDDPATIASGPTVGVRAGVPAHAPDLGPLLARCADRLPPVALAALARPSELPALPPADFRLIATPAMALDAAAAVARSHGLAPLILGDALEGESRQLGIVMAGIARSVRRHGQPLAAPAVLLSGGETTVTFHRDGDSARSGRPGRGGRNTEFLLGLAVALGGDAGIWALAGDTDGIDGTEDAAGAFVTPDTLARARAQGLDPGAVLAAHDSYTLFDRLGDLIRTGPTLTNVNDFRAILVA